MVKSKSEILLEAMQKACKEDKDGACCVHSLYNTVKDMDEKIYIREVSAFLSYFNKKNIVVRMLNSYKCKYHDRNHWFYRINKKPDKFQPTNAELKAQKLEDNKLKESKKYGHEYVIKFLKDRQSQLSDQITKIGDAIKALEDKD